MKKRKFGLFAITILLAIGLVFSACSTDSSSGGGGGDDGGRRQPGPSGEIASGVIPGGIQEVPPDGGDQIQNHAAGIEVEFDQTSTTAGTIKITTHNGTGGFHTGQGSNFTVALAAGSTLTGPSLPITTATEVGSTGVYTVPITGITAEGDVDVTLKVGGTSPIYTGTVTITNYQAMAGALALAVNDVTGVITPTVTGGPGNEIFSWTGTGVPASTADAALALAKYELGEEVTCKATVAAGGVMPLSATITVCEIVIDNDNSDTGNNDEEATLPIDKYVKLGTAITIAFDNKGNASSKYTVTFEDTTAIALTAATTQSYTPVIADAIDGKITIKVEWED
jgi:hypothetical protein